VLSACRGPTLGAPRAEREGKGPILPPFSLRWRPAGARVVFRPAGARWQNFRPAAPTAGEGLSAGRAQLGEGGGGAGETQKIRGGVKNGQAHAFHLLLLPRAPKGHAVLPRVWSTTCFFSFGTSAAARRGALASRLHFPPGRPPLNVALLHNFLNPTNCNTTHDSRRPFTKRLDARARAARARVHQHRNFSSKALLCRARARPRALLLKGCRRRRTSLDTHAAVSLKEPRAHTRTRTRARAQRNAAAAQRRGGGCRGGRGARPTRKQAGARGQ
jgi:hypothetical protein